MAKPQSVLVARVWIHRCTNVNSEQKDVPTGAQRSARCSIELCGSEEVKGICLMRLPARRCAVQQGLAKSRRRRRMHPCIHLTAGFKPVFSRQAPVANDLLSS